MVFFCGFGARPAADVAVRAATVRGDGREHYGAASGRSLGALVWPVDEENHRKTMGKP